MQIPDWTDRLDMSKLLADSSLTDTGELHVDRSGRPKPKHVRVQLNSGIEVKCDVRYDGIDRTDDTRRFLVIAEIDWENYYPKAMIAEECPTDAALILRVPGMTDADHEAAARTLRVVVERWIHV